MLVTVSFCLILLVIAVVGGIATVPRKEKLKIRKGNDSHFLSNESAQFL